MIVFTDPKIISGVVVTSAVSLSATGNFKGYAVTLELTGADGRSHHKYWVCRYYQDGRTELDKLSQF